MIGLANFQDNSLIIGMKSVNLNRGQFLTSQVKLAERWGWNRKTVKSWLLFLQKEKMITTKMDRDIHHGFTIITITNYNTYQPDGQGLTQEHGQQRDRDLPTIKESKKDKKERNNTRESPSNWKKEYGEKYISGFNKLFNTHYRLTASREKKLKDRFKEFTPEQISKALYNLASSPFHCGENDRGWKATPDFLIRSDEQVDIWLNYGGKKE